jgi:hypothetical protein
MIRDISMCRKNVLVRSAFQPSSLVAQPSKRRLSSEAGKTATRAMSSGCPMRPVACARSSPSRNRRLGHVCPDTHCGLVIVGNFMRVNPCATTRHKGNECVSVRFLPAIEISVFAPRSAERRFRTPVTLSRRSRISMRAAAAANNARDLWSLSKIQIRSCNVTWVGASS